MNPFLALDKVDTIVKRMTEEFVPLGCTAKEIKMAVEAGWKEWGTLERICIKKGRKPLHIWKKTI